MTAPPLQAALYIVAAILVAWSTHLLIWYRLILSLDLPFRYWRAAGRLFAVGTALLPVGMLQLLLMRHIPRLIARPLMTTAFTWAGLIILLLWSLAVLEIVRAAARPDKRVLALLARGSVAMAIVAAAVGMFLANKDPDLVFTEFNVAGDFARYRIVQLTDLHIGPTLGRVFASRVVDEVNALHPDLIVITGDMVDGSVGELEPEVAPLKGLAARDGVAFVLGNHEYLSGVEAWVKHVESFGWRVLRNSRVTLPALDLVGLDDSWESPKAPNGLLTRKGNRPVLLLAHQPQAFSEACRAGVDVALAGHTHGGQIFPFGIWEQLQQGYLKGTYRCGATQLYVSSGAGYWGPPMRLGSRNEVSVIELRGNFRERSPN